MRDEREKPRLWAGQKVGLVSCIAKLAPSGGTYTAEFMVTGGVETPKDFESLHHALLLFCERFNQGDL